MSTRTKTYALLAATALATMIATPALAQQDTQSQPTEGESPSVTNDSDNPADIIVTARRTEEKLQDVPISITVFTQDQLTNRNITNTADLGTYTPSLSTNSKYGPEKASFVIRGFVQDLGTQPSVGVYFADVVGPRSGGSTTSGNGLGYGNMFDLQNVQVLKGPQGTLFGRNTTGGAVLLVPQKPTDKLEGYVEGSYGNYDMKRIQAVANIPLADTFRVRLGFDHQVRDGYLINHTNIGPSRLGDVNYWAARLSIVGELTPNLENYVIASYARSKNNGVVPRVVGCNRAQVSVNPLAALGCAQLDRQSARGDSFWDVENTEPNPLEQQETWQVINTTTWQASDNITVKNIASYAEFRERIGFSLEGENFQPALSLINIRTPPGYDASSQSTLTEELQIQGKSSDGRLNWQVGGYLENSSPLGYTSQFTTQLITCADAFNFQCNAGGTSGSISWPFQKTFFRDRGLYAQATYDITDQLSVTGGIRYTWDTMTHSYDQMSIRFPAANTPTFTCPNVVRITPGSNAPIIISGPAEHARCNSTFTAKSSAPTWLLDVDYKPNDDILLYAKWARGYRAGGAASANILFETWQPEKVDTYEIGAKTTWRGGVRGYFNVAAFYNDFSNQQVAANLIRSATSPLIGGQAILNAGKSRIWGIELDTSLTFFDSLRVDLGYTYLNTKVLQLVTPVLGPELAPFYSAIVPTAQVGGDLALSPNHRLTLTGTYTLPLDPSIGKVALGVTYVYTSEQVASLSTPAQFGILPANSLINLNLNWSDAAGLPIDLAAFVTNLTNEEVPVNVSNAYGSFGFESQMTNQPRMYGVRLRYKFGR